VTYRIKQYALEQGALEIQYMEEFFGEFPGARKTAAEIVARLERRDHSILMAESPLPDDPTMIVPVAYRVSHELRAGSLAVLDVQGLPLMLNWYVVQRRQKRLPPVAQAFRQFLLSDGARLIDETVPLRKRRTPR